MKQFLVELISICTCLLLLFSCSSEEPVIEKSPFEKLMGLHKVHGVKKFYSLGEPTLIDTIMPNIELTILTDSTFNFDIVQENINHSMIESENNTSNFSIQYTKTQWVGNNRTFLAFWPDIDSISVSTRSGGIGVFNEYTMNGKLSD